MSDQTSLERQVPQKLLDGDDNVLSVLRQQVRQAVIQSREMTGVGFFTRFQVPPQTLRVAGRPSFKLGDVIGTADNLRNGLGFLLYIDGGAISTLEGYTYDEPWPAEMLGLSLAYATGQERDLSKLRASWGIPS